MAFTTPKELFHFKVMPFGLHGAVATFQQLIDTFLARAMDMLSHISTTSSSTAEIRYNTSSTCCELSSGWKKLV